MIHYHTELAELTTICEFYGYFGSVAFWYHILLMNEYDIHKHNRLTIENIEA